MRLPRTAALCLAAAVSVTMLTACGGGGGDSADAENRRSTPATSAPTAGSTATSTSTTATAAKPNANTATITEMTAAFSAAGIASPDRWAREVEEYRPYPTTDPTMAKLRQELAKYNPGPGVVDQIVANLSLS